MGTFSKESNYVAFCVCILMRHALRSPFLFSFPPSQWCFWIDWPKFFCRVFLLFMYVSSIGVISLDKLAHSLGNACSITCCSRRVWPTYTYFLQSTEVIVELAHQLFLKLSRVLEAHVVLCVTVRVFEKKIASKIGQKQSFLNLLENVVIIFF